MCRGTLSPAEDAKASSALFNSEGFYWGSRRVKFFKKPPNGDAVGSFDYKLGNNNTEMAVSNASSDDTSVSYGQYLNNDLFPDINDKTLYKK